MKLMLGNQSLDQLEIQDRRPEDMEWFDTAVGSLGGPMIVSNGELFDLGDHPSRIAWRGATPAGLSVYRKLDSQTLEVLAFKASVPGQGVGSALLKDLDLIGRLFDLQTIVLDTTNDNLRALRFYQRNGFSVRAWRCGAFRHVLALKGFNPNAPFVGDDDIEIRDVVRPEKSLKTSGLIA